MNIDQLDILLTKNKVRARLDLDWAECNFGEDYNFELNKARDIERSYDEVRV